MAERDNNDPQRLSDGRQNLGSDFARPVEPEARDLGQDFARRNAGDDRVLGAEFAEPERTDERVLGESFADPNSADDIKLGNSFAATNSSAKKHHRPVREVVEAPFHRPGSKRVLLWIVAGVVVVFLLLLLVGWLPRHSRDKETAQKANEAKQEPTIEVIRVTRAQGGGGLVVPGTTTPLEQSSVYARANGYLKQRFVDIGDRVHKGQLLAIIDAPDLDQQVAQARQQVNQAEAQLAQQQTQLALAKITNDRYQALVARGVFSRQDGDQREADYQAQRANVAAADRNVEAFRANLRRVIALQSYERVTAPFDGIVTQRNVDNGDLVSATGAVGGNAPMTLASGQMGSSSPGQNASTNTAGASGSGSSLATPQSTGSQGGALFTIAQNRRLRILVSVPEGYASQIRLGQRTLLHFQEFADQPFYADITRTAGAIDQNTRTLLTELQIDNDAGRLLPGMYAVATFAPPPGAQSPLVISGDAIAIRNDRPTVAVIDQGKVNLVPVSIGRDYGPEVEIVGGLHEGQMIAETFTDDVMPGAKVKVHEDKKEEKTATQPAAIGGPTPPGGSTQYGNPAITDQDMQGQKPGQQKGGKGAAQKSGGKQ